jgi:hypothetical protein
VVPLRTGQFRIAAIEVPKHLVDDDEDFYDEDMFTSYVKIVDAIDQVDTAVQEAGADPESLDAPWRSNFPL